MESEAVDIAAPHVPPYHFSSAHGYNMPDTNNVTTADDARYEDSQVALQGEGGTTLQPSEQRGISDPDDLAYSEDDEDFSDDELSTANPSDYTKAYNRQRRLHDPAVPLEQKPKSNPQRPKANVVALIDDQISSLSRHAGKLKLDAEQSGLGTKGDRDNTDRANRATSEQVLDPKTRMILLQMINRGVVSEINGCISTGKEANVYHAVLYPEDIPAAASEDSHATVAQPAAQPTDTKPEHFAIKIFKTSILTFKDRSAYIEGEFRFSKGYKHRSNHAMVRLWAEKEFRNLKRMHGAGLPVPEPMYLRAHVLMMRFVGSKRGWSAPLLRDVTLEDSAPTTAGIDELETSTQTESKQLTGVDDPPSQANPWTHIYHTLLTHVRTMYRTCQLVHADLSEFNILYHTSPQQPQGKAYIIDVGQSVSPSHPNALSFLRNDLHNLTVFFGKQHGVTTLAESTAFSFVTADKAPLDKPGMTKTLEKLLAAAAQAETQHQGASTAERGEQREQDEQVFRQQYIPQTLGQVYDVERDAEKVARGEGHELVYASLLAPGKDDAAPAHVQESDASPASAAHSSSSSTHDADDSNSDDGERFEEPHHQPRGKRFEDKSERKEHKAAVKEEKREKRKTKMPKHVKNKLTAKSSRGHKK